MGRRLEGIETYYNPVIGRNPWMHQIVGALNRRMAAGQPPIPKGAATALGSPTKAGSHGGVFQKFVKLPANAVRFSNDLKSAATEWITYGGRQTGIGNAAADYVRGADLESIAALRGDMNAKWGAVIVEAIRHSDEMRGTVHRGLRFEKGKTPSKYTDAKRGDVLTLDAPESFSTKSDVARQFMGAGPVEMMAFTKGMNLPPEVLANFQRLVDHDRVKLVIQDRYKGLYMGWRDVGEKEILTYGRFRVDSNIVDKTGMRVIVMRQLTVH